MALEPGSPSRPGRRKLAVEPVHVSLKLTLHPGQHDRLIKWFASLEPRQRATAVLDALMSGGLATLQAFADEGDEANDDFELDLGGLAGF